MFEYFIRTLLPQRLFLNFYANTKRHNVPIFAVKLNDTPLADISKVPLSLTWGLEIAYIKT